MKYNKTKSQIIWSGLIIIFSVLSLWMMMMSIDLVLADPTNNPGVLCARLGTHIGLLIRS